MANPSTTTPAPDEVAITIADKAFRYWSGLEIHRGIDSHATVGFSAPFEFERPDFRSTFRPFSFPDVEVTVGGDKLFTGTLVDVNPRVEPNSRTVQVTAYSRPAVLEDSDIPAELVPFETNGLSLRQIAQRLAEPFGVTVAVGAAEGSPFKRVKRDRRKDGNAHSFLTELAQQRGLVISSTADGELVFQKSTKTGKPVARLEEGKAPVVSVVPTFSPQSYYSEITGFVSTKAGNEGSKYTERNTRLSGGALRAHSFVLDDTEKADAPAAVKAKMGRMFANVVSYVVNVPTWRDPQGALWTPNTTLVLKAPHAMVYTHYEFLIRDVILRNDAGELNASLGLVLPGAFSGELPTSLPWDGDDTDTFIDDLIPGV